MLPASEPTLAASATTVIAAPILNANLPTSSSPTSVPEGNRTTTIETVPQRAGSRDLPRLAVSIGSKFQVCFREHHVHHNANGLFVHSHAAADRRRSIVRRRSGRPGRGHLSRTSHFSKLRCGAGNDRRRASSPVIRSHGKLLQHADHQGAFHAAAVTVHSAMLSLKIAW